MPPEIHIEYPAFVHAREMSVLILEQLQVVDAVPGAKEDVATVAPALGDVACDSRHDTPGVSWHSNV
jgi:hypothetical protein